MIFSVYFAVIATKKHNCCKVVIDESESCVGGQATCSTKATCENCLSTYGEFDSNVHAWNNGEITTAPTCTEKGVKTYTCTHNSEHTKTEDLEIDSSAHAWDEGKITIEPAKGAPGVKEYTCLHDSNHTKVVSVAYEKQNSGKGFAIAGSITGIVSLLGVAAFIFIKKKVK